MQRLIDANALIQDFDRRGWDGVQTVVDMMPTIDAVPVVRCKDCKHHHWEQEPCHGKTVHLCDVLKAEVWREFFCSYGERKDGEG